MKSFTKMCNFLWFALFCRVVNTQIFRSRQEECNERCQQSQIRVSHQLWDCTSEGEKFEKWCQSTSHSTTSTTKLINSTQRCANETETKRKIDIVISSFFFWAKSIERGQVLFYQSLVCRMFQPSFKSMIVKQQYFAIGFAAATCRGAKPGHRLVLVAGPSSTRLFYSGNEKTFYHAKKSWWLESHNFSFLRDDWVERLFLIKDVFKVSWLAICTSLMWTQEEQHLHLCSSPCFLQHSSANFGWRSANLELEYLVSQLEISRQSRSPLFSFRRTRLQPAQDMNTIPNTTEDDITIAGAFTVVATVSS